MFGEPVVYLLVCFLPFAHEAAGEPNARHSLRPLWAKGFLLNPDVTRRGNVESHHRQFAMTLGCLTFE